MEKYNYKNLSQLIGEKVTVRDEQQNQLELTIAEVCVGSLDGDEWEAFSVIFNGEKGSSIPQGTYTFLHERFDETLLFLSPNSEIEYETVVTRKRV